MDSNKTMEESQPAPTMVQELVAALELSWPRTFRPPPTPPTSKSMPPFIKLTNTSHPTTPIYTQFLIPLMVPTISENSLSSTTAIANDIGDASMQLGDGDETEKKSKVSIDKVEERIRQCFIKNKRALSQSRAASLEHMRANWVANGKTNDFYSKKLRATDFIYQFHG